MVSLTGADIKVEVKLGHAVHDLLSRTSLSRFHRWRSPPDFSEASSIMLENLCWIRRELKTTSRHHRDVDPNWLRTWQEKHASGAVPAVETPDELLDPILQYRNRFRALSLSDGL
jgi:metallopeptidase MepB